MIHRVFLALSLFIATPAFAAPKVATDIAPVHSLVSMVMGDIAEPSLIVPPGASPHGYALRPSEARALAQAELVVFIGSELSPAFDRARAKIAVEAVALPLLDVEGTLLMDVREGATFGAHDHDHGHDAHDDEEHEEDHAHDDDEHEAEAHEDEHAHDAAENEHDGEDAHGRDEHDGIDPHAWLDPVNAVTWLGPIAEALAALDPANAEEYRQNASDAAAELAGLEQSVGDIIAPVRGKSFVVQHDAYHYFEARFDIEAAGAIAAHDAAQPGPARVQEVRQLVADLNVVCILSETEADAARANDTMEGAVSVAIVDPLGAKIAPGPGMYPALLTGIAQTLADCL